MGLEAMDRGVNHCLLEGEVLEAPQIRYTQDNQTPVAEMTVRIDGLRPDDPPGQIKVVGWGNLAQDLQQRVTVGQRLVLEGRLRMNTVSRPDGVKEKRAEFTLARLHPLAPSGSAPQGYPGATAAAMPDSRSQAPTGPASRSSGAVNAVAAGAPPRRTAPAPVRPAPGPAPSPAAVPEPPVWNTSPLVPDDLVEGDDDIPF
jgi:single-stranded DNA-binding protein